MRKLEHMADEVVPIYDDEVEYTEEYIEEQLPKNDFTTFDTSKLNRLRISVIANIAGSEIPNFLKVHYIRVADNLDTIEHMERFREIVYLRINNLTKNNKGLLEKIFEKERSI